jgi:hypothetical protein
LLLRLQEKSQRKKLDDEAYMVTLVQVTVISEEGQMVDADIST